MPLWGLALNAVRCRSSSQLCGPVEVATDCVRGISQQALSASRLWPAGPRGPKLSLNDWGMRHHRHRLPWRHRHDHQHPRLRASRHHHIVIESVFVDIVIINGVIVLVCRSGVPPVCRSWVSPAARLHGVGVCSARANHRTKEGMNERTNPALKAVRCLISS